MQKSPLRAMFAALVACGLTAGEDPAADLQTRINQAEPKALVAVPAGTWEQALVIDKALTLRGASPETSILKVTSDAPLVWVKTREPVQLEGLTLIWQRATSEKAAQPPSAVLLRDATVTLRNCRFVAPGGNRRCPAAVMASGFSELELDRCRFEGFEFTIQIWDGAQGKVTDCVVLNPGHCGITVGQDARGEVIRNVVTGSEYHAIRCTGGTLEARDNLIVRNKNRGFYLGNRTGKGNITNNLLLENGTGISAFASAEYEIANNVLADCDFAGLDTRNSCRIQVKNNVICGNTRGFAAFDEGGAPRFTLARNVFWANQTEAENCNLPSETLRFDPKFANPAAGDFALAADAPDARGQGLTNPEVIRSLWKKLE